MTIYYEPEQGPLFAALHCRHTIFSMLFRVEYWLFLTLHIGLIVLMKYGVEEIGSFRWEAAGVMQIFMMFMLIFYNTACYQRYRIYYTNCMQILRHAVLFTEELCTCCPFEECEQYRVTATRYIIAGVYLFYMGVTGFDDPDSWQELKRKGLVQAGEIAILQEYPARVYVMLSAWAMQVVGVALTEDCFWTPNSAHIGHIHNRLNAHVLGILRSCSKVSCVRAMPIPYPYFQLMNFILLFNFLVIGFALATLKTWGTILAFGFVEMIYMGLRNVSVGLSEPFEMNRSDFPLAAFMDYVFDHSIGILEAFSHPLAYARLHKRIHKTHNFSEDELVASCLPAVRYKTTTKNRTCLWGDHRPLSLMHSEDVKRLLSHSFVDPDDIKKSMEETMTTHKLTAEDMKVLAWRCHHCGKVFRPDCLHCKRCGRKRPKQLDQPPDEDTDEPLSSLDYSGWAKKDGEAPEVRYASAESMRALEERQTIMERLRDKLGAARIRLAVLQAAGAGESPTAAGPLGTFKATLDAALALENAPPENEEASGDDALSPVLARAPGAYNSKWAGQVGLQADAGHSPAKNFDKAQQAVRSKLDAKAAKAVQRELDAKVAEAQQANRSKLKTTGRSAVYIG